MSLNNAKSKALDILLCCQRIWHDDPDMSAGLYPFQVHSVPGTL